MDEEEEIKNMAHWKEIEGYEGLYLISDEGEVMSLPRVIKRCGIRGNKYQKQRILKPGNRAGKYKFVVLCNDSYEKKFSVHRLVAEAFIKNPNNLPQINHKDENPSNNKADNLEWCSQQYNIEYSKARRISQYDKNGEKIAEYKSIVIASEVTKISRTAINNTLLGWSNTAGGYYWKYED